MEIEELNKLKDQLEEKSKCLDLDKQNFADLEDQAKDKFEKDIKGYVFHEIYKNIKEYIKLITDPKSKINCLVLESEQGIGKTTIVKNALKE
jgi:vacuolar-type H+-ATPase subunit I/STV1